MFSCVELFQEKEFRIPDDVDWKEQCKILLDILNQSEDSVPFRQPISILDVPDYPDNIVIPMDLQTVGKRLKVGNYATPTDFAKDVRLIFETNPNTKSRIVAMNCRLSILFEKHFRDILATYDYRRETIKIVSGSKDKDQVGNLNLYRSILMEIFITFNTFRSIYHQVHELE